MLGSATLFAVHRCASILFALCVLFPGLLSAKRVHTAEAPLGNFSLRLDEASEALPPEPLASSRVFDPYGYDGPSEGRYCGNDPINKVDVLGLDDIWVSSEGVVKWAVRDSKTGVFGFLQSAVAWVEVGSVDRIFEWGGNSGHYRNGKTVRLKGGETVPLSELESFAKANPLSGDTTHWRFKSEQAGLVGDLVARVAGGAAASENGASEFFAGAHDRVGGIVQGIDGLILRDGLLGSNFFNWERWNAPAGSIQEAWGNLYGNSVFKTSPSTIREERYDWVVNENTGYYQGGGTAVDVAAIIGPWAWSKFRGASSGLVNPAELRWSQTTAGGRGRAAMYRDSLARNGWKEGEFIDVVVTPDGLATLDHTRAAIALELNMPRIPARFHLPGDPLPADMLTRGWNRAGDTATTWGEALRLRGAGQIPPIGPTGSPVPPRLP